MQYRDFGKTRRKVSALGFGMMRLPTTDHKPMGKMIDIEETKRMVQLAVDNGVNYIDTAYAYHGGKSESVLGGILKGGYRDRTMLATKCPVWLIKKPSDFDKYLDQQLRRLRTDRLEFYLFHGLNGKRWDDTILKRQLLKKAEAAKRSGKIEHIGFSFHDDLKAFKKIVDGFDDWSFCQIQYNYMDTDNQAGTKGLRYAASKGLGVVVMEPLLGGRLSDPPKKIRAMIREEDPKLSPSDLALQWVWNQPEVSIVLSGMSSMRHVRENLASAEKSGIGSMTADRLRLIKRLKKTYSSMRPIPCTRCRYCMPCPNGVDIPENFEEYVEAFVHEDPGTARMIYSRFMTEKQRASSCKQCGKCEERCPQKIPIRQWMPEIHRVLGEGRPFSKA